MAFAQPNPAELNLLELFFRRGMITASAVSMTGFVRRTLGSGFTDARIRDWMISRRRFYQTNYPAVHHALQTWARAHPNPNRMNPAQYFDWAGMQNALGIIVPPIVAPAVLAPPPPLIAPVIVAPVVAAPVVVGPPVAGIIALGSGVLIVQRRSEAQRLLEETRDYLAGRGVNIGTYNATQGLSRASRRPAAPPPVVKTAPTKRRRKVGVAKTAQKKKKGSKR